MNREKTVSILAFYRDADAMIENNARRIAEMEVDFYNPLGAVKMDGLPHGSSGRGSSTETAALNVPQYAYDCIKDLRAESGQAAAVKQEIFKEINRLPEPHRTVVFGFYIERRKWERISAQIHYSVRQCKNFRGVALDHLGKAFGQNRVIKAYNFKK